MRRPALLSLAPLSVGCATLALAQEPLRTFRGVDGARFGHDLREAGDVDLDGLPDLLVGLPGVQPDGAVHVISAGTGRVLFEFLGDPQTSGRQGWVVAPAGDMDADGLPDFLLGNPYFARAGMANAGRVEVRSGADGSLLHAFLGDRESRYFGWAMDALGDVDGDGHDDVAIGAAGPGDDAGRVLVLSGRTGGVVHVLVGPGPQSSFGVALANVGDANGDGVEDLVVGAPGFLQNGLRVGEVSVWSGVDGALVSRIEGEGTVLALGLAVVGVGDLDGDGRPELMASAREGDEQVVTVLSGAGGAALLRFTSKALTFGETLCGVGDADGDGIGDLLVGTPQQGRADLYSGADGSLLVRFTTPGGGSALGSAAATLRDLDGDGRADFALAAPEFGSYGGRVRVHSGCKPLGVTTCGPAVPNSTGVPGRLRAFGSGSVAANSVHLAAADLPAGRKVVFLTSETPGFVQNPGGSQGNLCLAGTLGRFVAATQQSDANGSAGVQIDLRSMPPPVQHAVLPGETWHFQAWYRDANPQKTSNFTDALAVTFS